MRKKDQQKVGLFDFFQQSLDEFLRNNPHLELQALEEQLREQEEETLRLIAEFQRKEKELQQRILTTAEEIQKWHSRIEQAKAKGKMDLAQAAAEREAELLRQGNQIWGQMQASKQQIEKAKELYKQIHGKLKEVRLKAAQFKTTQTQNQSQNTWQKNWSGTHSTNYGNYDPLEQQFREMEREEELENLKRNMKK